MTSAALFQLGRQSLQALIDELAVHDVTVDPALELRQGEGLLSYYSLQDEQIYLSVPDPCQPPRYVCSVALSLRNQSRQHRRDHAFA